MAQPRVFTVSGSNITIAGAPTLVFLNPPAAPAAGLQLLRAWVGQRGTTTAAMLGIQLSTQVTAFPTLVSATPAAHNRGDTVASVFVGNTTGAAGTAGINASAEGAGAKTVLIADNFNNQIGWVWVPTDAEQIVLPAGLASGLGLVLMTTPGTLTGWSFGLTFQEKP